MCINRDCYIHGCHSEVLITQQQLTVGHLLLLYEVSRCTQQRIAMKVKRSKDTVTTLPNNFTDLTDDSVNTNFGDTFCVGNVGYTPEIKIWHTCRRQHHLKGQKWTSLQWRRQV